MKSLLTITACLAAISLYAQPVLETGNGSMPNEWIDKDTHHKLVKLTRVAGENSSFYFHNNPFIGSKMVFYNTSKTDGKQLYTVDLKTLQTEQITHSTFPMGSEIVGTGKHNIYYQVKDSVYVVNIDTKESKLLYVFPADYKGSIATVNADETILAGAKASDAQKEILKQYPEKTQYFNRIFDAHLPNELFTINIKTGELQKIHQENTWLGHVQFSPTDPQMLMFCHEGPWHKVDRIWTINVHTRETKLMHKRTMDGEIAGHEWFAPDGKTIWYDLQMPKGETFFVAGTNIATGEEKKYALQRNEWSIHFNISRDQKLFCGDGGDPGQVAKAPDGEWLYLFTPAGDSMRAEKLVNMKHHNYHLEPNVHFSPDGKWIIFRANFEGVENSYAVEIKKS